jgi:hypothetical protein
VKGLTANSTQARSWFDVSMSAEIKVQLTILIRLPHPVSWRDNMVLNNSLGDPIVGGRYKGGGVVDNSKY